MSVNLLELLKSQFSDDLLGQVSKYLGENSSNVSSALGSGLPSLIGGVIEKSSTTQGASSLMDMISKGGFDGNMLNNVSSLFSGGTSTEGLINSGKSILNSLFGNKLNGVSETVSSLSGMKGSSVTNLLAMAAPILMSLIGKQVKSTGLDASGLTKMLGEQSAFLKGLIPAGLISSLGLGNIFGDAKSKINEGVEETKSGFGKILPWLIGILILGLLTYFLSKGCNKNTTGLSTDTLKNKTQKLNETQTKKPDTLKSMLSKTLPGGVTLNFQPSGVEAGLIGFIEDKSKTVDKETWFSFDRLYFETNSAKLSPQSKEQLSNIAAILKAYPNVELKIGGYTDNTGDAKANQKLSQQRAESTMQEIILLGISPNRLKAEGYGQEHPVADNSTEAGRAANRRIDVRVTKK